ncbi:MAG: prepilin-type cleavage/methylation domain-containing protein, partial [Chlorobia bacterium]|nr:prepilin-type cleavage/methylation domain-containing protein [Fimbriimonadaceae bacterium]
GWAADVLRIYTKNYEIWIFQSAQGIFTSTVQVRQAVSPFPDAKLSTYWLWRFDRPDDPIALDNLWGKTDDQAVADLQAANNPQAGRPDGVADIELAVDPYFPRTIPTTPPEVRGKAVHAGGRNRLFLDGHAKWLRDIRTN